MVHNDWDEWNQSQTEISTGETVGLAARLVERGPLGLLKVILRNGFSSQGTPGVTQGYPT